MKSRDSAPQRARRLLDVAVNMTLATVGEDGAPWVSPVFYVPDSHLDLFWTSEPGARHSRNVVATGRVAIVIVEPDPDRHVDALYISATARELADPAEIGSAITVMTSKSQPERWRITSPADVGPDGPWRIYRAHPLTMEVRATDEVADKAVARRVDADFRPRADPSSAPDCHM